MKDLFGHSSLKGLEKEAWGTFSDIVREEIIGLVGTLLRGLGVRRHRTQVPDKGNRWVPSPGSAAGSRWPPFKAQNSRSLKMLNTG